MMSTIGRRLIVIALLLLIGCWPHALAQAQANIDQAELTAVVRAVRVVETLQKTWAPRLLAAQNESDRTRLRDAARSEVIAALDRIDGITTERYDQIRKAVTLDPQLMARVTQLYSNNGQN